ncbi:MAG: hypothetical protein HY059_10675 [Proteobacteria bacterium]|nr:hypothetical protein [Pseudomonadota bacterium]
MKRILVCLFSLSLGACAVGNQHDYSGTPQLALQSAASTAVGVQDQRPYVVDKDKAGNFSGLSRGGFGNPFNVTTLSGNTLAADFSTAVVTALKGKGVDTAEVPVPPGQLLSQTHQALLNVGRDRSLLIGIREWKSDTYMATVLLYDLNAMVFDKGGRLLAENTLVGHDSLGGSAMNPPGHAKEAVPPAFRATLAKLLNDPKILAALR